MLVPFLLHESFVSFFCSVSKIPISEFRQRVSESKLKTPTPIFQYNFILLCRHFNEPQFNVINFEETSDCFQLCVFCCFQLAVLDYMKH